MKPTFNLSQVNPVAPMAQGQENFKTHDKTTYSFLPEHPKVKKTPRSFKIVLCSLDKIGGGLTNPQFLITLPPDFYGKHLNVCVESVLLFPGMEDGDYTCFLSMKGIGNTLSYYSKTKNTHDIVAVWKGRTYYNHSPRNEGGATITNTNIFQNPITFEFTSPDAGEELMELIVANDYVITLTLYDAGEN